jgi:membrane-associated phospholipid phosphatase
LRAKRSFSEAPKAGFESEAFNRLRASHFIAFLRRRLSPEGFLGLHLTLSILILIAATWAFGAIAEDVVTGDRITIIDARFSAWLHIHGAPFLTRFMLLVSDVHETVPVLVATAAVCVYLWVRRLRVWVLTFAITVGGGTLLNVLLKHIFHRTRPYFENPIVVLTTYSFPSGHTIMATVFYGTCCVLIWSRVRDWKWRIAATVVATALIFLVGFSRIYLGAHYLSDVVAAMLEGVAWITSSIVAIRLIRPDKDSIKN